MSGSIGTGLGAAIIIDGELVRFAGHTLGDSGHIILDPDGPTCPGRLSRLRGSADHHPGGRAGQPSRLWTTRAAHAFANRAPTGWAHPGVGCDSGLQEGDPLAREIMASIGRWLGQWLACLAPVFLPERIVLCGGISAAGEALLAACRERFYEITGPEYARCDILLGKYKGYTGVIGAAVPFLIRE